MIIDNEAESERQQAGIAAALQAEAQARKQQASLELMTQGLKMMFPPETAPVADGCLPFEWYGHHGDLPIARLGYVGTPTIRNRAVERRTASCH